MKFVPFLGQLEPNILNGISFVSGTLSKVSGALFTDEQRSSSLSLSESDIISDLKTKSQNIY